MTATEIARIFGVKRIGSGKKWRAKCPAHKSRGLTLAIYDDKDKVGLHCHAGCSQDDVLAAVGLTWKDLKPRREITPEYRQQQSDAAKLDDLMRKHGLMLWMASLELDRRHYWHAAMRRVAEEMEPLYWRVMPDKEDVDKVFAWEAEEYRKWRADWLLERNKSAVLLDGK